MLENAFILQREQPTDEQLATVLGPVKPLWDQLVSDLGSELGVPVQEWNSYSVKAGWALRLKRDKRAIVYLSPGRDCFMASFALGGKAIVAARERGLPKRVMAIIDGAKKYAEGTAVRIEVKKPRDAAVVKKLAAIKLAH